MKKFFSFLMMAMLFTTAYATEATMAAGTNGSAAKVNDQDAIKCGTSSKAGDMTITVGAGATELTFYAAAWNGVTNSTLTITPEAKVSVSEVALTANTGIAGNSPFTLAEGTDEEDYKFTITLSNVTEETTFTLAGAKRFVVWNASYTTGSTPVVTVATPAISGTTPFDDETEVSISCETAGASIYYTLDGSTPSNQSTQYTGAFNINATTTVKAIAYKDNTASSVASKVFTMNPKRVSVGTVDALNKLADDTEFTYISDVVVTGQTGQYLYVQDETAATLIYGQVGQTYNFGDVIMQGWTGKKVTFKGAPEMTNLAGFQASFFTAEVPVKEFDTKSAASLENFSQYGVIKNVTIDLEGKKLVAEDYTEIAYYDRFKVAFPEVVEGKKFNVNIIVGYYDAPQVYPVAFEEVVEPVAPTYSLVGYINGANYGCEEDFENPGEYLFEDGKLRVTFAEPSYVFVKTTDNSKWFLTQNYIPFNAEYIHGDFFNGANYGEKMQVPAGVVDFRLTVVDEDHVYLSATGDFEEVYYMKHPWGGGDWTWKELTDNEDGTYSVVAQYGGNGVNVNTTADDAGAQWFAEPELVNNPQTGDEVTFVYSKEENKVTIIKEAEPAQPRITGITIKGQEVEMEEGADGAFLDLTEEFTADDVVVTTENAEGCTVVVEIFNGWLEETDYFTVQVSLNDADGHSVDQFDVYVTVDTTPTGINDINTVSTKVVKMIENGQVVIVKNGVKYNVAGQAIK